MHTKRQFLRAMTPVNRCTDVSAFHAEMVKPNVLIVKTIKYHARGGVHVYQVVVGCWIPMNLSTRGTWEGWVDVGVF